MADLTIHIAPQTDLSFLHGQPSVKDSGRTMDLSFLHGQPLAKDSGRTMDLSFLHGQPSAKDSGRTGDLSLLHGQPSAKDSGRTGDLKFLHGQPSAKDSDRTVDLEFLSCGLLSECLDIQLEELHRIIESLEVIESQLTEECPTGGDIEKGGNPEGISQDDPLETPWQCLSPEHGRSITCELEGGVLECDGGNGDNAFYGTVWAASDHDACELILAQVSYFTCSNAVLRNA